MSRTLYAGFDLGGTQLKYGLVDGEGSIIFKDKTPTPVTIAGLIELLRSVWTELRSRAGAPVAAAGLGFPGIYSRKDRRVLQSPNYPGLDEFDLAPALAGVIDAPHWVNNDANLAAYGEWAAGAGRGAASLVLLTIGTGIGSGIILDGELWTGACGFAGELGHVVVNPEGDVCNCGVRGCLETETSAPTIVKNYRAFSGRDEPVTAEDVYLKAKAGDSDARQSFAKAGYYLGIGLGIVVNFLNPEKILLGGGVMTTGEYLMGPAVAEARRRCFKASFSCCSIEKAVLGNDAGLVGAAAWAKSRLAKRGA
jgi:glucokinase